MIPPDPARPENRPAVVIPTYNHGRTVASVTAGAAAWGLPTIVVDDGSTDDTAARLKELPDVQVLRHTKNRGKGAALLTGLKAAARVAGQAITLDADGQHLPQDIGIMCKATQQHPGALIVGQRAHMAGAPWTSRFGRGFSNFWLWTACGLRLSDSQSGFRVYPLPQVLDLGVRAHRYQFEIEVLARAVWAGLAIHEVPVQVDYAPQGGRVSHFHPWRDFVRNARMFSRIITRRVLTPRLWGGPQPGRRRYP